MPAFCRQLRHNPILKLGFPNPNLFPGCVTRYPTSCICNVFVHLHGSRSTPLQAGVEQCRTPRLSAIGVSITGWTSGVREDTTPGCMANAKRSGGHASEDHTFDWAPTLEEQSCPSRIECLLIGEHRALRAPVAARTLEAAGRRLRAEPESRSIGPALSA